MENLICDRTNRIWSCANHLGGTSMAASNLCPMLAPKHGPRQFVKVHKCTAKSICPISHIPDADYSDNGSLRPPPGEATSLAERSRWFQKTEKHVHQESNPKSATPSAQAGRNRKAHRRGWPRPGSCGPMNLHGSAPSSPCPSVVKGSVSTLTFLLIL